MFVGRTEELALLRAELRAAAAGSVRRVVVEGPEGIGKTALINHALDGEAGARVLMVSGEEDERELPLGIVRQLIAEATRLNTGAPAGTAARLDPGAPAAASVSGRGLAAAVDTGPTDTLTRPETGGPGVCAAGLGPRGVGVGPCGAGVGARMAGVGPWAAAGQVVCDLVGRLAGQGLLGLVVDDAQWVDQPSLRALGYALRRVRAGKVIVLVACRDLGGAWLPEGLRRLLTGDDVVRLTLRGLSPADLIEIASDRPPVAIPEDLIVPSGPDATMQLPGDLPDRQAAGHQRGGAQRARRVQSSHERTAAPAASAQSRGCERAVPPGSAHAGGGAVAGPVGRAQVGSGRAAVSGGKARAPQPGDAPVPVGTVGAGEVDGVGLRGSVAVGERGAGEGVEPCDGGGRGAGLGEGAAVRLWEHSRGNPLHARALLEVVPPAVLRDPWARLPAPETYRRIFARRLRSCTPATRRLVSACAVLGEECPLHVAVTVAREVGKSLDALEVDKRLDTLEGGEPLDALAVAEPSAATGVGERFGASGVGESVDALEEAVGAGLLRESPGRMVGFVEPLARAAAYDGIGAGMRARLHLAASRVTEDTAAALRHRAAAADGPDEVLAEELAGYAAKAAQHGLWQEAAAHLDLAAGLTESAACRDELRTAVLEHVLIGGDVLRAAELAAVRNADPRPVRRYVLGRLALAAGRFDEASELLGEAWRHAEPGFAADVAEQLAWLRLVTGDRAAAADWARLAIEQPIQGMAARPYDVLALAGAPCAGAPPGSLAAAVTLLARDEPGQARAMLGRAAGSAAPAHHRLLATALLAVAEHACARWDKAAAHAEYAFAQAAALGQRWLLPSLAAACVAPLAALGEHVRALTHATEAAATARRLGHGMGERQAALALALLTPGEAPPAAHLPAPSTASGMYGVPGAGGDREPGGGPDVFVPDPRPARIEALVADGRLEEAERALAAFDSEGTRYDADRAWQSGEEGRQGGEGVRCDGEGAWRGSAEARCDGEGVRCDGEEVWRGSAEARRGEARRRAERARLRGLLLAGRNTPAQAEEAFARALSLVEAGVCPLEEARVLLDLGRLLRRTGRRKVAAERLGAARAIFERLGARPLAERCGKELEACGMEPPATARLGLTPQELSTATLVAGGLTNRQIARELLISVKTVEYHIGKIYTKLGISSRVALAAKLAI